MVNIRLFNSKMALYGDDRKTLAEAIGIHEVTLCMKVNGKAQFKQAEIKAIALRYSLTPEEIEEIFFGGDLSECG